MWLVSPVRVSVWAVGERSPRRRRSDESVNSILKREEGQATEFTVLQKHQGMAALAGLRHLPVPIIFNSAIACTMFQSWLTREGHMAHKIYQNAMDKLQEVLGPVEMDICHFDWCLAGTYTPLELGLYFGAHCTVRLMD